MNWKTLASIIVLNLVALPLTTVLEQRSVKSNDCGYIGKKAMFLGAVPITADRKCHVVRSA